MENKYLILIIIGIFISSIFAFGSSFYLIDEHPLMKNMTFDEINVSVPAETLFNINPGTNTYSGGSGEAIWITPYNSKNSTYKNIEEFFSSYNKDRDVSEIKIKDLNNNSKVYILNDDKNYTIIMVSNNKKDMGMIIETSSNRNLIIQMANSIIFPN